MLANSEGEVAKFTNDPNSLKARLAQSYVALSQAWREQFGDFPVEPAQFPIERTTRYSIDIPTVTPEVYAQVVESLEKVGITFKAPIREASMNELMKQDTKNRLGYVNDSKSMRATVPPAMEVAINPNQVRIEGSNNLPTDDQKDMIAQYEVKIKQQLPEDIRNLISIIMADPSTDSQLEDAYMDETGNLLFPNFFARTDVETVSGYVARVGRDGPADPRNVVGWRRVHGAAYVFAVPVVVLPRVLAS